MSKFLWPLWCALLTLIQTSPAAVLTVTNSEASGTLHHADTSEFSLVVPLIAPTTPVITMQPPSTNVAPGTTVTLCVVATGSPAPEYQWRRNGVNIPGQTASCLTIPEAEAIDGGSYSVVVGNSLGAVISNPASVMVNVPSPLPGDNFGDRGTLVGGNGVVSGTNAFATSEVGERNHGGKPGGKSVWYRWIAPDGGTVNFQTTGSSFDTLLAVYSGSELTDLTLLAEDEDQGGFLSSLVRFNVEEGVEYQIAIDGYAGEEGRFVLSWSLEQGIGQLPQILSHPKSQTVGQGSNHTFTVVAEGGALTYRWFVNGVFLDGATNDSLMISNVQIADLGAYVVRIQGNDGFVDSIPASLQINLTGAEVQPVLGMDKFQDAVNANNPLRLGTPTGEGGGVGAGTGRGGGALSRGYSGTHTFNTFGSKSQAGEPNHCGIVGGASQWFTYQAEEPGVLFVNTDGSNFDTILAIYTGTGSSFASLQELGCDNNSGIDGIDSSTSVPVSPGIIYLVVIDGVRAATGSLTLNYTLVTPARLNLVGFNGQGQPMLQIRGRADMKFLLQRSGDFSAWTDLLNTTSPTAVFNFTDPSAEAGSQQFYRAQMRP